MTSAELDKSLRNIAAQERLLHDVPAGGYVMIFEGKVTGWALEPDPTTFVPGVYVVPIEGAIRRTIGGTDQTGAKQWEILSAPTAPAAGPTPLQVAKEAIAHVLNAICDDPQKFYLMGHGTGSYTKLTAAHAVLQGMTEKQVREDFVPDQERYDSYCARREEEEQIRNWVQDYKLEEFNAWKASRE